MERLDKFSELPTDQKWEVIEATLKALRDNVFGEKPKKKGKK